MSLKQLDAVAGSSISDISFLDEIQQAYAVEISAFESAVSAHPLGAAVVLGYEVFDTLISPVIDVIKNIGIWERDKIITEIMSNAGISNTSYSKKFIAGLDAIDTFIEDSSWVFTEQSLLDYKTPYEVGKAIVQNDTNLMEKVERLYREEFTAPMEAMVLSEVRGPSAAFWLDYYYRHGCLPNEVFSSTYKPISFNSSFMILIPTKYTKEESADRMDRLIKDLFASLKDLYTTINEELSPSRKSRQ